MTIHRFDTPFGRTIGHDYTFQPKTEDGTKAVVMGWCSEPTLVNKDDVLVLVGPNGGGSPYRVVEVKRYLDPPDMFRAKVVYERNAVDDH